MHSFVVWRASDVGSKVDPTSSTLRWKADRSGCGPIRWQAGSLVSYAIVIIEVDSLLSCLGMLILCEESTECIPFGISPMPFSVRNNQRTA
jgi:hypothetical protein